MNKFICFVHIEKAGGITLHNVLHSIFLGYITPSPAFGEHLSSEQVRQLLKVWPIRVTGIGGHRVGAFLGYESVVKREIFYFTFLRDPIARYMSHMNWQKHIMKLDWSPASFTANEYFNNFQCYRISGERNYESAKKVIKDKFSFVGYMEEYDTSLILLSKILGIPNHAFKYQKANLKNYGLKGFNFNTLCKRDQQSIIRCNQEDIKLYDFLRFELFPKYETAVQSIADDLQRFQNGNKNFKTSIPTLLKRKTTNLLLSKLIQPYFIKG